jgi:hypothetical protein
VLALIIFFVIGLLFLFYTMAAKNLNKRETIVKKAEATINT